MMGMMGKPDSPENEVSAPTGALTCVFLERMTRFELATLTWLKNLPEQVHCVVPHALMWCSVHGVVHRAVSCPFGSGVVYYEAYRSPGDRCVYVISEATIAAAESHV